MYDRFREDNPMDDASFEKVSRSDKPLYGPRKLLLCGFPVAVQPKFGTVLNMAELNDLSLIWVDTDKAEIRISNLLALPDGAGKGVSSELPRGIIVAGITETELHRLMAVCRQTGMKHALWAVLTPTSETWTVQELLTELQAEREALAKGEA